MTCNEESAERKCKIGQIEKDLQRGMFGCAVALLILRRGFIGSGGIEGGHYIIFLNAYQYDKNG